MSDVAIAPGLAKVVRVSNDDELVINWGADDGVKRGDVFLVYGQGPLITDPDTGRDLGRLELVRGRGEVVARPGVDGDVALHGAEITPHRTTRAGKVAHLGCGSLTNRNSIFPSTDRNCAISPVLYKGA